MKHAYLIMAHNQISLLKLLLHKLDDANNTIYLHFDSKFPCDVDALRNQMHISKLYPIKRMNVGWGKYSMIQCELELLKEATKGNYDYYHLITGVDLPLKSNVEMDAFFEAHNGTEFIAFDEISNDPRSLYARFDNWHFQLAWRSSHPLQRKLTTLCNIPLRMLEGVMNKVAGNRSRKYTDLTFRKGSAYFDITHALAVHILEQEALIRKLFRFTSCCDEVFLHTMAYNSPFADKLAYRDTRYIDWSKHGDSPEILTLGHYESMMQSGKLFARKFSTRESKDLIEKLYGPEAIEIVYGVAPVL